MELINHELRSSNASSFSRRETILLSLVTSCFSGASVVGKDRLAGLLPQRIAKGFNLPDQVPFRSDRRAKDETLRRLRSLGMSHVRIPVRAENVLARYSGPATISSSMDDLDGAVERLLEIGYSVSVDLHPGDEFIALQRRDPESAHRALLDGWTNLANRIRKWPQESVFAELLNEPAQTDEVWRPFVETLAKAVRAILPKTFILVGPAPFHRAEALARWRPLDDDRIVYVCHFYDPMIFTHQGASWDRSSAWARAAGVPFPSAAGDSKMLALAADAAAKGDAALAEGLRKMAARVWNAETIFAQFAELGRWSAKHSAPVVVNEFGVLKWKARRADRLAWLAAVRVAIEAQGFGWAHWDYDTAFGLLDEAGEIDQEAILALLPETARSTAPSVKATKPITTGSERGTK